MYDTILVPTTGLTDDTAAIDLALDLAVRSDAAVHLIEVVDDRRRLDVIEVTPTGVPDDPSAATFRQVGDAGDPDRLAGIESAAEGRGVEFTSATRRGVPFRVVLDAIEEVGADAVVLNRRRAESPADLDLERVAARVLGRTDVPVFTVADAWGTENGFQCEEILVPVDGSDHATRAMEAALDVAATVGAAIHVLYIVDDGTHRFGDVERSIVGLLSEAGDRAVADAATIADEAGVDVTTDVRRGNPPESIVETATARGVDLLAMGNRGQTLTDDPFLGSTTDRVLRRVGLPVLTVG